MLKCGGLASTVKLERRTGSEDGQPWLRCIVHTRPAELSRGSGRRQMTSCFSRWSAVTQIISSNDVKQIFFLCTILLQFSCKTSPVSGQVFAQLSFAGSMP